MPDSRRNFLKKGASLAAVSAIAPASFSIHSSRPKPIKEDFMQLCMSYFFGFEENKMAYSRQMGVTGAVTSANPNMAGLPNKKPWEYEVLAAIRDRFAKEGLQFRVLEGPPSLDKAKLGIEGKDEQIDNFITLIQNLSKVGVDTICYNWMPVISWHRTDNERKGRGDALMTAFDYNTVKDQPLTEYGEFSPETMWKNLEYFLKAVIPEAEKAGVKLAMHPDDPPVSRIRGISRILTSVEAFKKLINLYPSPSNGITFCQGTFATMGEDIPSAIRYFGKREKIFFVHFRDVLGDPENFTECFHDNGKTDMYEAMKAYIEVGFKGPIRPDHVPTMANDSNTHPGYSVLGKLFAVGYIRGLMEAAAKES
ncbi:MAG: mannonate dehydratase [Bacteroidia bacterium]|nr:mannonate dehydratase [Bacteroidia bacterium]